MEFSQGRAVVLTALSQACSQDTSVLKPVEHKLQQWESQPGFYSILQSVFSDHTVDHNIRWLAVLYFKNGVDRYWRRNTSNSLADEEKTSLRQNLISHFNEPVPQIATQISVVISKIARLDCPRLWPELLPKLLLVVQSPDALIQQRALLTLHHVTKSLASKRLANDRRAFEELTSELFGFILSLWGKNTESFIEALRRGDRETCLLALDHSTLTLKVLRKLVVYGIKEPEKNEQAMQFVSSVLERIEQFLHAKAEMENLSKEMTSRREKILIICSKMLLDMLDHHPWSFIHFIERSLKIAVNYTLTDDGRGLVFERLSVNLLNVMRGILRAEEYRPAKVLTETKNPLTVDAYKAKMGFFTETTLREICQRLVLWYFPLSPEDLQCWDTDPEDFMTDEGGDSWKFSIRPCTENLYLTLVKEFRLTVTPIILDMVQQCQGQIDVNDLPAILRKDAVYNAIGQVSFDFCEDVDFDPWFENHLLAELQIKHPNYRIIRKRVIWLIGNWVSVKLSTSKRPMLYEALLPLLQSSEDIAVRVEAALTLKSAVDDFDFKQEQFLPYLEASFGSLFALLKDVDECESKMQILHVMSFIIERMTVNIRPHAAGLLQYLPLLWLESEEHNMLRCAILTTLTNLVFGLGTLCTSMHTFLAPIIRLSTDVNQEPHVYLCEDGLDLWLILLQCSPSINDELLDLYSNMPALLEMGTETLRTNLKIIESYILLGPKEFLMRYSDSLVKSLVSLLDELKTEGVILIYKVIELVLKVFPQEGPRMFEGMLPKVLQNVIDCQDYPMETALQIALISRVALQNQSQFFLLNDRLAQSLNKESSELLGSLLDAWTDKLDSIIQPERKKLSSLALASLLTANTNANWRVILDRFNAIMCGCVETLHDVCKAEIQEQEEQSPFFDSLLVSYDNPPADSDEDTEHDRRKRQLTFHDPVYTVNVRDFVIAQLKQLQAQVERAGGSWEQLFSQLDIDVSIQLKHFLQ